MENNNTTDIHRETESPSTGDSLNFSSVLSTFTKWKPEPLDVLKSDREQRLLYFSLTGLLAIIVVAISSNEKEGYPLNGAYALCNGAMLLQFLIFITFLLYFSPKECVRSCSSLYVCGNLCITEFIIGGLGLCSTSAFSVRGTSYIVVGVIALVESSSGIEWTLFRLMGSIILEIGAWILLIIVHWDDDVNFDIIKLSHHTVVSIVITLPLWYALYFHMKSERDKYNQVSDNQTAATSGNQETKRNTYIIDSRASLKRSSGNTDALSGETSAFPKFGTTAYLRREATKNLLVQQIMSGVMIVLHILVTVLVILNATGHINDDIEHMIYSVVVNSALGLWQVSKIFMEYGWELSDQHLRFLSRVERAQKETIRTIQSLADELKWPLASLRGMRLARESKETIETLKRATRSLIWVGHLMRMLEISNEAAVFKRIVRRPRKIAIQHLIKTVSACLNCQTTANIKDLNTTVSVNSYRVGGKYNPKAVVSNEQLEQQRPPDIHVWINQEVLLYGLLGMHSLIVALADPHQELRMDFSVTKTPDGREAVVETRLCHWGQCPVWELSGTEERSNAHRSDAEQEQHHLGMDFQVKSANSEEEADIQQLVVENLRNAIGGSIESSMRGRMCETIFRVTLPTSSRGDTQPTAMHMQTSKKNKCVLLVEDSNMTRKIMKKHIEAVWPGSEIEECTNGEEAIVRVAHLGQEKFDIIFLDYYLGTEKEMTGVQLCMKLRQYAVHATIIGCTGDENGIALPDFLLNGADLVFLKPIHREMLAEVFDKDEVQGGGGGGQGGVSNTQ